MTGWSERTVRVGDADLSVWEAGEGRPLIVIHDELGPTAWLGWHEAVARKRRLVMPILPGARAERIGWIRSVRDVACLYSRYLRSLNGGAVDAIGFSFGGWIAAEMAANNASQFGRLALVAPFGIKPSDGFIMDMFPIASADYIRASVRDSESVPEYAALYGPPSPEQFEAWEDARTECARLGWEPYMHNPTLEHLLEGAEGMKTLILWGEDDAILPRSAAEAYRRSIPGSELKTFKQCGHRPEIEQRETFLDAVVRFFG